MSAELDFSPATRPEAAGMIGAHIAFEVTRGRSIRDAAGDALVQLDYDEHPFLLDDLAADPAIRAALTAA